MEELIAECEFLGVPCDLQRYFTSVMTPLGRCYTFNGRNVNEQYKTVPGIGYRHGLEPVLNLQQDEFAPTFTREAGTRVVIHNQKDPPAVLENSLSVPVGQSAYISGPFEHNRLMTGVKQDSQTAIYMDSEVTFELLQSCEYSLESCLPDCILKNIADVCKCIHGVDRPKGGSRGGGY